MSVTEMQTLAPEDETTTAVVADWQFSTISIVYC